MIDKMSDGDLVKWFGLGVLTASEFVPEMRKRLGLPEVNCEPIVSLDPSKYEPFGKPTPFVEAV